MKKGERAVLTVAGCEEPQLGLKSSEKVILTLELTSFEKAKDTWDMSEEEKVEYGAARKDVGANLFKAARYQLAMERYKKVADLFSYIDNYKEENKAKAIELKTPESAFSWLIESRAEDVKKILELEPNNREARALAKNAQAGQKEEDKKSKGLFGKMCKALGKGPIPEPYKDGRDTGFGRKTIATIGLRELLFELMEKYFAKTPNCEGLPLQHVLSHQVYHPIRKSFLKSVSLKEWIDRRIGGEVATKTTAHGQAVIYYRTEGEDGLPFSWAPAANDEPEMIVDEPMEATEALDSKAQAFFNKLPPDGFLPEEEQLREVLLGFLESWMEPTAPTLAAALRSAEVGQRMVPMSGSEQVLQQAWLGMSEQHRACRLSRPAMRLRLQLFVSLLLSQLFTARAQGQIKGRVSIPHKYQEGTARVILDGGAVSTLPVSDGHFALNGVTAGPHLLQVVHPLLSFDPVRIEATEGSGGLKMSAYIADFEHGKGVKLKYPLGLAPSGEFNVISVFKSPMAIIGLVSMGAMFFLPKLQSMVEEEKETTIGNSRRSSETGRKTDHLSAEHGLFREKWAAERHAAWNKYGVCLANAPSVSLKMWIDRRIGGEIATWKARGQTYFGSGHSVHPVNRKKGTASKTG
eukprot:g19579.t1